MRRREFIAGLAGGAAAWSLEARAQDTQRARRVGVLMLPGEGDPEGRRRVEAFQQGMERLGWRIGRNLLLDYRWNINNVERARTAAEELLTFSPDLLLANGVPALPAAQKATRSVPIVFTVVNEPVAMGVVASLARPGGNITGFANLETTLGGKWLQLLKEIAPSVRRVAVMYNPDANPSAVGFSHSAETAGQKLSVLVIDAAVREPPEIEAAIIDLASEPGGGLLLPTESFTTLHRALILKLAARHRLPAMYLRRFFAEEGGLISYGVDVVDQFRQAATYVDLILRGETPGNLPVQQPTKFELVINLKTANALGLTVPPTLIVIADEVIE